MKCLLKQRLFSLRSIRDLLQRNIRSCSDVCKRKDDKKPKSRSDYLKEFGAYVHECLPKFVQRVQFNHCKELEIMVAPDGLLPTMQVFLEY